MLAVILEVGEVVDVAVSPDWNDPGCELNHQRADESECLIALIVI